MLKSRISYWAILLLLTAQNSYAQDYLREWINAAVEQNGGVKNARLDVETGIIKQRKVKSTFLPTLTASATYARAKVGLSDLHVSATVPADYVALGAGLAGVMGLPENPIPGQIETTINKDYEGLDIFTAGLSSRWILFTGFKAYHLNQATIYEQQARQQLIRREKAAVIREVVQLHDKLALIHASENVLAKSRERLQGEKKRVMKAFEIGLASKYDAQKIELASLNLQSKAVELAGQKRLVKQRIHQLTGIDESELQVAELEVMVISTEILNSERPEILAMEQGIKAHEAKVKSVNSGYMPKVALMGSYQYMDLDLAKADPIAFVGVGASWNLFDGFHTNQEKQLAKIEMQKAQNECEEARHLSEMALEKAGVELEISSAKLEIAEQGLDNARLAHNIRKSEFVEGLVSVNEFLEAESDLQNAQLEFLKAMFQQRQSVLSYYEATGNLSENIFD